MADILAQYLPQKKGPSLIVQIAVMAGMTVAAVGIGWFGGSMLSGGAAPAAATGEAPAAAAHAPAADAGHGEDTGHGEAKEGEHGAEGAPAGNPLILNLAPITTNLAAPSDTWLRLELAVQLETPSEDPTLADTIQQDLLAYMRTVKLHQIEGASGFQHLKADLTERAAIRSDGNVKAVLIRTLLFE
jgi:flagellar protein FliL